MEREIERKRKRERERNRRERAIEGQSERTAPGAETRNREREQEREHTTDIETQTQKSLGPALRVFRAETRLTVYRPLYIRALRVNTLRAKAYELFDAFTKEINIFHNKWLRLLSTSILICIQI